MIYAFTIKLYLIDKTLKMIKPKSELNWICLDFSDLLGGIQKCRPNPEKEGSGYC